MSKPSSKLQLFIARMKEGEEFERHGFDLILGRINFETLFDSLSDGGLFDPSRNFGPIAADKPGYYRLPYWPPLQYLEAVAKRSGERSDAALAEKVMSVVRHVSTWRDVEGNVRDNQNTWRVFTKIYGLVPTRVVTSNDIDLIPTWLAGKFDRSSVGYALAGGTLRSFLASDQRDDWLKACRILHHCTAIRWIEEPILTGETGGKAQTLIDDFWLKEIIRGSATLLGKKLGREAADVFLMRLTEVFAKHRGGQATWLARPAIEDNPQNYDWHGPENRFVEGLRNSLLGWVESDRAQAETFLSELLSSGAEIVERVAIHVIDQQFELLRPLVSKVVTPVFFNSGHLHELYLLLAKHFQAFTTDEKARVVEIIRDLPLQDVEKPERFRTVTQRRWLSAIAGEGYVPVDEWFQQLNSDPTLGKLVEHPEFIAHVESHWGSGPTPYTSEQLTEFARDGTVVSTLNAFVPSETWNGPTARSLADAVTEAVASDPQVWLAQVPRFLDAKVEYQYAIMSGFKKLWAASDGNSVVLDWDRTWRDLISFFESLLGKENFWNNEITPDELYSPNRIWVLSLISEFIKVGTHDDRKAYAPDLLPRTWALLRTLLAKSPAEQELRDDALTQAINSPKGKAVDALFDHALRWCRVMDQQGGTHSEIWAKMRPVFDAELASCRNANFEFSALTGAYIANIYYLDQAWLIQAFARIFPTEYPLNCRSALDGLAFAPASGPIYRQLVDTGVLEWALRHEPADTHARENLLQRMALAYIWKEEELDSPRFVYVFHQDRIADLENISRYFWIIRGEPLSPGQKERVFDFWDKCMDWSRTVEPAPAKLLSGLSRLTCYMLLISDRDEARLLAVAPYVSADYSADQFIEELNRLADGNLAAVGKILATLLEAVHPVYDLDDKLRAIVTKLAMNPETRLYALQCLERVRYLPGMLQLYKELTSA